MQALLQRVREARVEVGGQVIAQIGRGLLVLVGLEAEDCAEKSAWMADKILNYRIFSDEDDKMNLSLRDIDGELLLVSQFTLAARTDKGRRPSFDRAMPPAAAEALFATFVRQCEALHPKVQTGQFAADMQVYLCNDGPVTFLLQR